MKQGAGSVFLAQHPMADLELVHSAQVYHSLAEVIDGKEKFPLNALAVPVQEERMRPLIL